MGFDPATSGANALAPGAALGNRIAKELLGGRDRGLRRATFQSSMVYTDFRGTSRGGNRPRAAVVLAGPIGERPTTGVEMRRAQLLRGVCSAADASVFVTQPESKGVLEAMASRLKAPVECASGSVLSVPQVTGGLRRRVSNRLRPGLLAGRDPVRLQQEFLAWAVAYDVVLVETLQDYMVLKNEFTAPIVLDLDDLESVMSAQRIRLRWTVAFDNRSSTAIRNFPRPLRRILVGARRLPHLVARSIGEARNLVWLRSAEKRAIQSCCRVLVCSEQDRTLLGSPGNVAVVPNGFDPPETSAREIHRASGCVVAMWGVMAYGPNADGARWMATEILPELRKLNAEAKLQLIGRGGDRLGLDSIEGVEVLGFVDDLGATLNGVDVSAVPLRLGGGTRIKILESWATGIPVVTTTIGAHGLEVRPEIDALVADNSRDFAMALHRVLSDGRLSKRLADAGVERAAGFSTALTEASVRLAVEAAIDRCS